VWKDDDEKSWSPTRSESDQIMTHVADFALAAVEHESESRQRVDSIRGIAQLLQEYEQSHRLIAYEIHDGLAQSLTAAISFFEAFRHQSNLATKAVARKTFDLGMEALWRSCVEVRRLIKDLRPVEANGAGLVAELERLVNDSKENAGIDIRFQSQGNCDLLPTLLQRTVLRIAQECLTNVIRHSRSQGAEVRLIVNDGMLRLTVRDRGVGFAFDQVSEGRFGLEGMRQRAEVFHGTLNIQSAPGQGTCVTVELPTVQERLRV
jgi:signal transduction histidine kinase